MVMLTSLHGTKLACGSTIKADDAHAAWIQLHIEEHKSIDITINRIKTESVVTHNLCAGAQRALENIIASYCCSKLLDIAGRRINAASTIATGDEMDIDGNDNASGDAEDEEESTIMYVAPHTILVYTHQCNTLVSAKDVHFIIVLPAHFNVSATDRQNLYRWFADAIYKERLFAPKPT